MERLANEEGVTIDKTRDNEGENEDLGGFIR